MTALGPVTELGGVAPGVGSLGSRTGANIYRWTHFVDNETVTELMWPASVATYEKMRSDTQIESLIAAATWPIRRYTWKIDPNGARPEIVDGVAADLGLPIEGQEADHQERRKGRFSHGKHLYHALLALIYGHNYFEQVGEIDDSGKWRLRKLSPRMPNTLSEISIEDDGGLRYIKQNVGVNAPEIPVDRLVAFIWDQEASNWAGRSMLRGCYKHWLIKDRLLRVDAINHERAGGVPVIEGHEGATNAELRELGEMAQQFKVGESSGGAVPHGAKLSLQGSSAAGSNPVIGSIRYHDEMMARRFLAMFLQLGQTETGSRALGETFVDWFSLAQEVIADWYADVMNEHVIEDWVDWNYADEDLVPQLTYSKGEDAELATADFISLIDSKAITVDDELEAWIREEHGLPEKSEQEEDEPPMLPPPPPPPIPPDDSEPEADGAAEAGKRRNGGVRAQDDGPAPTVNLPARTLRRQPYAHEVQAQVDFARLDAFITSEQQSLVMQYKVDVQADQIRELGDKIAAANGNIKQLAGVRATPAGANLLHEHMIVAAAEGIEMAVAEAAAQGATLPRPSTDNLSASLLARAQATEQVLSNAISEAAQRRAIALTGGSLLPSEVGAEVVLQLQDLKGAYLEDQFGGLVTAATNTGRRAAFSEGEPSGIFASELLDTNTCARCTAKDGQRYQSIEDAENDYPTGGYRDCLGGPRCRGTLVAIFPESEPSVA